MSPRLGMYFFVFSTLKTSKFICIHLEQYRLIFLYS
jgi:hypothetical protein